MKKVFVDKAFKERMIVLLTLPLIDNEDLDK